MAKDRLKSLRSQGPDWLPWNKSRSQRILLQTRELFYERVFSNALPRLKIEDRYFPLRNAANYSLLYLIMRVVTELPIRRVLELGCGQTTLLLDDLAQYRELDITSIEHDPVWAERIQGRVRHKITQAPLVARRLRDIECQTYNVAPRELPGPMDLIIADGPPGQAQRSRWGTVEYVETLLQRDFVIIFDDAQRKGEQDTIAAVLKVLDERGVEFAYATTRALKTQYLIAAGALREAAYY